MNSTNTNTITVHTLSTSDTLIIIVPVSCREEFNKLINRGANLWPDAKPYIKEFADLVTSHTVYQDYYNHSSTQMET